MLKRLAVVYHTTWDRLVDSIDLLHMPDIEAAEWAETVHPARG
ncbi:hypothetical protein [Nocardia sp. GAS34]